MAKLIDKTATLIQGGSASMDARAIASFVSSLGAELPVILDEINDEFIRGCVSESVDLDSLSISEMQELSKRVYAENPIEELLELEKNLPVGAILASLLPLVPSSPDGTPESSVDLFDPAGESAT